MRPILFAWRGFTLHSYHVMIYGALLTAVVLAVHLAQRDGLNPDRIALAVILLFIPGFVGARLLYVSRHWDQFRHDPTSILRRSEGGMSVSGGLLGVFASSIPVTWALGLPFAPFMDALVLGLVAGIVVAKGGCLLNGCCYGRVTGHWCGVTLPDEGGLWRRRFPSQPIEMAWAVVVLLLMLAWRNLSPPAGALACAAIALHSAGRMALQKLRDEGPREDAAVRKTGLVFIAVALAAGLLVWRG